jgi:hypothetical protein
MACWKIRRITDEETLEQETGELRKGFSEIEKRIFDVIDKHDGHATEEEILTAPSGKIDPVSLGIALAILKTEGSIILEKNSL